MPFSGSRAARRHRGGGHRLELLPARAGLLRLKAAVLRGVGTLRGHLPPRPRLRRLRLQHVGHEQLQLADARLQRRRPLLRAPPIRLELEDLCTHRLHRLGHPRDDLAHRVRQRAQLRRGGKIAVQSSLGGDQLRRGGKIAVQSSLGGEPEPAGPLANEHQDDGEEAQAYRAYTHASLRHLLLAAGPACCHRGARDSRGDAPRSARRAPEQMKRRAVLLV